MIFFRHKSRLYFRMNALCFQRCFCAAPSILTQKQIPSPMETHFWYVLPDEVRSASLLNQYFELLSPCERENVLSMRGDELKKRALLARVLVRTTIARYTNFHVDPKALKFRKNKYGKPELDWQAVDRWQPPPLHFNISHTSSLIACGVSVDSPIGIDVEEKNRKLKNHVLTFARRYFSSHEVEYLTAILDLEIQHQEFMKLWTLKESYVKALGRGFSATPFKTFTIRFASATKGGSHVSVHVDIETLKVTAEPLNKANNISSNWQFAVIELCGSHYAAICMENPQIEGRETVPMEMSVWRTIPFLEDECINGTNLVVQIA